MSYKLAGVIWNDDGTMATKELTSLEAFYDLLSPIGLKEEGVKKYCLIEAALKDYEHLYQIWNCKDSDTMIIQTTKTIHDENNKKLKALEIIKKYIKVYKIHNGYMLTDENSGETMISKEEYDLLKEVLM